IDAEVKMVICDSSLVQRVNEIKEENKIDFLVLSNGEGTKLDFKQMMQDASKNLVPAEIKYDDLASIMYTGGTTGRSKGVMHTHKTVISIMYSQIVEFEIEREGVVLHFAPLPHTAGFMVLSAMLMGGRQILQQHFDPKTFCETTEKEKVSFTFMVPTMIYTLLDMPGVEN